MESDKTIVTIKYTEQSECSWPMVIDEYAVQADLLKGATRARFKQVSSEEERSTWAFVVDTEDESAGHSLVLVEHECFGESVSASWDEYKRWLSDNVDFIKLDGPYLYSKKDRDAARSRRA